MHAAKYDKSPRLKAVHELLMQGPQTTRDIIVKAGVCAVSAAVAELRQEGIKIECKMLRKGVFEYRLTQEDNAMKGGIA